MSMDITALIELARIPVETVGIILLLQIRHRLWTMAARIAVLERKAQISYPVELIS